MISESRDPYQTENSNYDESAGLSEWIPLQQFPAADSDAWFTDENGQGAVNAFHPDCLHPFVRKVLEDVYGPRQGGSRIIVDAMDSRTGAGKTSFALLLALNFAKIFGYEMTNEDFTLSGKQYLERWKAHPDSEQPSVIVLDEVGTIADARRAMSNKNVNLARSWEIMRKKRIVTICTVPDFNFVDSKMRRLADYRVCMLEKPFGYAQCYKVKTTFSKSELRLLKLGGRIRGKNMDGHPAFDHLNKLKDKLLDSQLFDFDKIDEEVTPLNKKNVEVDAVKAWKFKRVEELVNKEGKTQEEAAGAIGMSAQWVSKHKRSGEINIQ